MQSPSGGRGKEPEQALFSPEQMARFADFLTGEQERDQRNFRILLESVTEILGETDQETLLRTMVDRIVQTSHTERGILLLHDGDSLQVRIARDNKGRDLGPEPAMSRSVPLSVFKDGKPVLARVGSEGDVLDLTRSISAMRLRQVMCSPLRVRGRMLGVIYIDSTVAGPVHTPADLTLFHTQAGLMAMAIENSRLFNETLHARFMQDQLRVARDIQRRLLPDGPVVYADADLAGMSVPFERVGGDYFDYFPLDLDRVGLAIADVSGHGIGPALIMSNVRAHLRSLLETRRSLAGLYGMMNRALCHDLTSGMFVSMFVAVYDRKKMILEFQNAGQTPPLLYHPGADVLRSIESNVPALGIIDEMSAGPCPNVKVQRGEYLICYTDGVTETPNADGEIFGDERLRTAVRRATRGSPASTDVVASLRASVKEYAGGLPPRDDITLLVARF